MANFPALGMRPHPLHPLAVRVWVSITVTFTQNCAINYIQLIHKKH